jgi:hypothetical protein
MGNVKHWSTGALGNTYGTDPGYENSKGLTTDNLPGIEAYVPEDIVDAKIDNRPLKNLTDNDVILETNTSDVASEVDHGVFKNRYQDFSLEIGISGNYPDPENINNIINITPLKIDSGSSIINGQITRIGNQKIVYFLRDDGSQLFPDYTQINDTNQVLTIIDPNYFDTSYSAVYSSVAESLPINFTNYSIIIRNIDTLGGGHPERLNGPYNTYRDWEDLIPLAPEVSTVSDSSSEIVSFGNDFNYGQFSQGYWLSSPYYDANSVKTNILGTNVDSVTLKKNILVKDKLISTDSFSIGSSGSYEYSVVTDGVFFDDVVWTNANLDADVQDLYIDSTTNDLYFITRSTTFKRIWYRSGASAFTSAIQLESQDLQGISGQQLPIGISKIKNYLVVYGTGGFINILNTTGAFIGSTLFSMPQNSPLTTQTIRSVYVWDNKVWIAGDTSLWYSNLSKWTSPETILTSDFTHIDLTTGSDAVLDSAGQQVISRINKLEKVRGNLYLDSSLQNSVDNLLLNPSFESGGLGLVPQYWTVGDNGSGTSTLHVTNGGRVGNYSASLAVTSPAISAWATQTYVPTTIDIGDRYTFSIYLQSPTAITTAPSILIEELDGNSTPVGTITPLVCNGVGSGWTRFSFTKTISSATSVSVRVTITSNQNSPLLIDTVQLELSSVTNQYTENFEYLLIGFTKINSNTSDVPFALIDISDKYHVKYDKGKYGSISSINDAISIGHNEVYFVSDTQVYLLTFLNNQSQYDRYTISPVLDEDMTNRVAKFESIKKVGDRIFFSGTPLNKVIRVTSADSSPHTIKIIDSTTGQSLVKLLGGTTFIPFITGHSASIEFNRVDSCYEGGVTDVGVYIPNSDMPVVYTAKIIVDDIYTDATISITPPRTNEGPWTIDQIFSAIKNSYTGTRLSFPLDLSTSPFPANQAQLPEWPNPISSSSIIDGLYSIGKKELSRHVKGSIHKIFAMPGVTSYLFVARGMQLLKSKLDPNILKRPGFGGTYPNPGEADYVHNWNFLSSNYNLTHYRNKINNDILLTDDPFDRSWFDFPSIDSGYSILKGSVRIKTNQSTEVGFAEDVDYVVDYENNKIIRYDGTNYLQNSDAGLSTSKTSLLISSGGTNHTSPTILYNGLPPTAHVNDFYLVTNSGISYNGFYYWTGTAWNKFYDDQIPNIWKFYLNDQSSTTESRIMVIDLDKDFANSAIQTWVKPATIVSTNPKSIIYQTFILPYAGVVGDTTLTFSAYLKSFAHCTGLIRIVECNSTNSDIITHGENDGNGADSTTYTIDSTSFNIWKKFSISHTFINSNSTQIRVEIQINSTTQILIAKTQLERSPFATPYMDATVESRINPDMHLFIDYTEYKNLIPTTDYIFNTIDSGTTPNRKIRLSSHFTNFILNGQISLSSYDSFAFQYKYEKIFNPLDFGNSLPATQRPYTANDDFFLYTVNGRIWAINQMMSILSLDTVDPLKITYNYHFPRIDQIKIRNTPDQFGNYLYIVKGTVDPTNPYKPNDPGTGTGISSGRRYYDGVAIEDIVDNVDNDTLYEINVTYLDYHYNNIFDRRIYMDAKDHTAFNISLLPETVAYFPFVKDFNSTNGIGPLNFLENSKIIPIIKNYLIIENNEVGAWHDGYQLNLRIAYPGNSFYVDPISGNDNNAGNSANNAFKTVAAAVAVLTQENPNIVITQPAVLNENIQINQSFAYSVGIYAASYCYWRGGLQNIGPLTVQGIVFQNTSLYPLNTLLLQWCTLEDSTISCTYPQDVSFVNTEFKDCYDSVLRVNNTLFPSPFIFPYKAVTETDVPPDNNIVADHDDESVYPGYYYAKTILKSSTFTFTNCLMYKIDANFVQFDPDPKLDWNGTFDFNSCTIAYNKSLFSSNRTNLTINYADSILYQNRTSSTDARAFTCNSIVNFSNCYTDFDFLNQNFVSSDLNYGTGQFFTISCSGGTPTSNPQFIGIGEVTTDFYLRSIARGSAVDSPCLGEEQDLGCFLETRGQTNTDVPKKLRSYVGFINEAVHYPITLNSEKITVTLEFKPNGSVSTPGILFDTRAADDDYDYIVLSYNNNDVTSHNPYPDSLTRTDPYRFRVLVGNKDRQYTIVSPIQIKTDEDFQKWHRISFTVNFEQNILPKTGFAEKDKVQNVVTLYHNSATEIESFIKYNLNRYADGTLISGRGVATDNDWDYNNICQFITLGSGYSPTIQNPDNPNNPLSTTPIIMKGYYTELRIDNRFINRKQFELWNSKQVAFNDPLDYINQNPLARTFENRTLSEYWALDTSYGRGAKGNYFKSGSHQRFMFDNGKFSWFLGNPITNLVASSNFFGLKNAGVIGDSAINWNTVPINFTHDWRIYVLDTGAGIVASRHVADNNQSGTGGVRLHMNGKSASSQKDLDIILASEFANWTDLSTMISYRFTSDGRLHFYTKDIAATSVTVSFGIPTGDAPEAIKVGYSTATKTGTISIAPWIISNLPSAPTENDTLFFNYDPTYLRYSANSLILTKANGTSIINTYQTTTSLPLDDYVVTFYIYYDQSNLNDQSNVAIINFYQGGANNQQFDSIERLDGNWWLATKLLPQISGSINLGISLIGTGTIYVDSCQLESGKYSTPYTTNPISDNGGIIINRDLINKNRGTIFFKFRPRFDFYEPLADGVNNAHPPKVLFELLGVVPDSLTQIPTVNANLGLRAVYYFDSLRNRGIIKFTINSDILTTWYLELVDQFWDQWHSVGIVYDFDTNRYVYWFDYFKNSIDQLLDNNSYVYNDLYIGRSTLRTTNVSSGIEIRDLIITKYPTSDVEIQSWINTYEFINISQISSTLIDFQTNIQNLITQVSGYTGLTSDVENQLTTITNQIATMGAFEANQNNTLTGMEAFVGYPSGGSGTHENRISALETSASSSNASIIAINSEIDSVIGSVGAHSAPAPTSLLALKSRLDNHDVLISGEENRAALAEIQIRTDLSSTSINKGASQIGIQDTTNVFTSTNVEGALTQLAAQLGTSGNLTSTLHQMQDNGDGSTWTTPLTQNLVALSNAIGNFFSTSINKGASLIGINDAAGVYSASTVEAALAEIAGTGRTTQTVASNAAAIGNLASTSTGAGASLVGVASGFTNINSNYSGVTTVEGAIEGIANQIETGLVADQISFAPNGLFLATNVQHAIAELAGTSRNPSMTVEGNYIDIGLMKDGSSGSNWSSGSNQNLVALRTDIDANSGSISTINTTIAPISQMKDANSGDWDTSLYTGPIHTTPHRANLVDHEGRIYTLEQASGNYLQTNPQGQHLEATLLPSPTSTIDLGNSTLYFRNIYASTATFYGSGTTTVGGSLTVSGNLTVNGTTTTINSTDTNITDSTFTIHVPAGGVGVDGDAYFIVRRGAAGGAEGGKDSKIYWNETAKRWQVIYPVSGAITLANIVVPSDLATTATAGLVTIGTGISVSGGTISVTPYSLPTASTLVLGGVKVDGTTITITNDIISVANIYTLPDATSLVKGGVIIGSNISVSSGTISITSTNIHDALGYTPYDASNPTEYQTEAQVTALISSTSFQGVWDATINNPTITSSVGTKGQYYIVNVAGTTVVNGISIWNIGDMIIFDGSVWNKIERSATITSSDVITALGFTPYDNSNPSSYLTASTLPTASTLVLGGVKVDGTTITIASGIISGAPTYTLPNATSLVKGGVIVGSGIDVSGGTISIQTASSVQSGLLSSTDWTTFNDKQSTSYTPTTSSDWQSAPTNIQQGLDNLANSINNTLHFSINTISGNNLTLSTRASGNIILTSAESITFQDEYLTSPISVSETGNATLASFFSGHATSIIGAINYIASLAGSFVSNAVTAGDTTSGYINYNGITKTAGQMNGGTAAPSHTIRLNYDGNLYATNFFGTLTGDVTGNVSGSAGSISWGNISGAPSTFAPPIATSSILGGVIVGSGIDVGIDGTISVDFAGSGSASSAAHSDHDHSGTYEPVISTKNTAFNVDFGTTTGTAAEGDHDHSGVYQPVGNYMSSSDLITPLSVASPPIDTPTIGTMRLYDDSVTPILYIFTSAGWKTVTLL